MEGQEAIQEAEGLLKASGLEELGTAVSASAYASLDVSKAALDPAREHSELLHQTLAQFYAGGDLARGAAHTAQEGSDVTRTQMKSLGKGKEDQTAKGAGRKIQTPADKAAEDVVPRMKK